VLRQPRIVFTFDRGAFEAGGDGVALAHRRSVEVRRKLIDHRDAAHVASVHTSVQNSALAHHPRHRQKLTLAARELTREMYGVFELEKGVFALETFTLLWKRTYVRS